MSALSPVESESPSESPVRGGVRAAGKARSRRKLLEAAKQLFMERGYHGATVRDIASAAGLSTGAVFASFSDKADLFNEVLLADTAEQLEEMAQAIAAQGRIEERLLRLLSAAYAYQLRQPELMKAAMGVSWSQGLRGELGDRPVRQAATGIISDMLSAAVEKGELKPGTDVMLLVDAIWAVHLANFRRAFFGGASLDELETHLKAQLDLLLAGQRKG